MKIRLSVSSLSSLTIAIVVCLAYAPPLLSLTFPQDFGYSSTSELLIDGGRIWEVNRMFHPFELEIGAKADSSDRGSAFGWAVKRLLAYQTATLELRDAAGDGLWVKGRLGLRGSSESGPGRRYNSAGLGPYLWYQAGFHSNWYATLLVRGTSEPESLPHYTGIGRKRSRFGMSTGEIDQSHFGYQNDWFSADFGRGREIWGTNSDRNLTLAGSAPSYERLVLEGKFKRFAYRYFYGFLESTRDSIVVERYTVGRALEYRNARNLVIGVSEVSILAGANRPVDWSFLNPFANHVEIEANKRNNYTGISSDVDYSLYVDWLPRSNLRLSGSFDIDDLQVDRKAQVRVGDMIGYLGHVAWTPVESPVGITLFADYVQVATFSMQHTNPYCNLVSRGELLGHPIGNDAVLKQAGLRTVLPFELIIEQRVGELQWGDNSLINNPYNGYRSPLRTSFPSGEVRTNLYYELGVEGFLTERFRYRIDGHVDLKHRGTGSAKERWELALEYDLPFQFLVQK